MTVRHWFATLLLLALVGLCVHRADAADAQLSWTLPTQNTDSSAIPASGAGSIASSRVEWGSCSGTAFGTKAGEATVPAPAVTYTVTDLAPATWCFRAFARNTYGVESGPSGVVSKIVPPPTPKPPVFTTVNLVVYETRIHPTQGLVAGRVVGSIALGATCYPDANGEPQVGADLYRVRFSDVTLSKPPRSELLVAQCAAS